MDVNSIRATAFHTTVPVAFACLSPLLFPVANVRSGCAASPVLAFLALMREGNGFAPALAATRLSVIRFRNREWCMTDGAIPALLSATAPSTDAIASKRAVNRTAILEFLRGSIERLFAYCTLPLLAIFLPVERFTRLALVPRYADVVLATATSGTVDARPKCARNRVGTSFAWMGLNSHHIILSRYAEMARRRIYDDAPLFAECVLA